MNTNPEILTLPPQPQPAPQPNPPTQTGTGRKKHRRTGKVASLTKALRDKVNSMLEYGVQYQDIIDQLGPEAAHLTTHNISEWKLGGGHQEYLDQKAWREDVRASQENFTDLATGADPLQLPEAGLQLAATGACELLRTLHGLAANADPTLDSDKFVRVANSLARLSRSILTLQQYRDAAAKAKALEVQNLDKDRDFVENERTALLDRADDLFGFKSAERLQREMLQDLATPPPPASPKKSVSKIPTQEQLNPITPVAPPQPEHPESLVSIAPESPTVPDVHTAPNTDNALSTAGNSLPCDPVTPVEPLVTKTEPAPPSVASTPQSESEPPSAESIPHSSFRTQFRFPHPVSRIHYPVARCYQPLNHCNPEPPNERKIKLSKQ